MKKIFYLVCVTFFLATAMESQDPVHSYTSTRKICEYWDALSTRFPDPQVRANYINASPFPRLFLYLFKNPQFRQLTIRELVEQHLRTVRSLLFPNSPKEIGQGNLRQQQIEEATQTIEGFFNTLE